MLSQNIQHLCIGVPTLCATVGGWSVMEMTTGIRPYARCQWVKCGMGCIGYPLESVRRILSMDLAIEDVGTLSYDECRRLLLRRLALLLALRLCTASRAWFFFACVSYIVAMVGCFGWLRMLLAFFLAFHDCAWARHRSVQPRATCMARLISWNTILVEQQILGRARGTRL